MVLSLAALLITSQVAVEHQPDGEALLAAIEAARAKRPEASALTGLKPGPIEPTLADDLVKYDWLEAGAWSYFDKAPSLSYREDKPLQHDWVRYLPDGGELRYLLVLDPLGVARSQVMHTNFTLPPPSTKKVVKLGKVTYLQGTLYGEKEHLRVLSYAGGVLILDITRDGKPGSKALAFRTVRVAMPRLFESDGK
jgi:hypothetical protein